MKSFQNEYKCKTVPILSMDAMIMNYAQISEPRSFISDLFCKSFWTFALL